MVGTHRRRFLQIAASAVATAGLPQKVSAAAYPDRPISLIVFLPAGGYPDIAARLVGEGLSRRLGQAVVVENRAGAGGNLALDAVVRAAPDGYTILLAGTPHAVNETMHQKSNSSLTRDLVAVAGLARNPLLMVVSPSLPVKTFPDFVAYAKANPGKLNLTSSGTGNLTHLAGELLKMMTGIDLMHVPFRGAVDAHTGLISGELHVMFDGIGSALPQVEAGKLRALAVTSAARWQALPEIPTVAEFVPNYVVDGWLGLAAPKGTPPEIVKRLNEEMQAVLLEPKIKSRLLSFGAEPLHGSPADIQKYILADTEKWEKVIRTANLKTQ